MAESRGRCRPGVRGLGLGFGTVLFGLQLVLLAGCADSSGMPQDTGSTTGNPDTSDGGGLDAGGTDAGGPGDLATLTVPGDFHDRAFRHDAFAGAEQCTACHDGLVDEAGGAVDMTRDWSASMMANASRDPYWLARVAVEADRTPSMIEEFDALCTRCHAPMANVAAVRAGTGTALLSGDGILSREHAWFDLAMDGVSCTVCHQVEDRTELGTSAGDSGQFTLAEPGAGVTPRLYGPFTEPSGAFMQAATGFEPAYSPHMAESRLCSACHDLRTTAIDAAGLPTAALHAGGFPEQMLYTEWSNSRYADPADTTTCQSCHMPVASGAMSLAIRGGGPQRTGVSRHVFLGANTVMQSMLRDNRRLLGIDVGADTFDASIERNRAFLQTAATLTIEHAGRDGGDVLVDVTVRNHSGHKLPSGYPSRRVFIHLRVTDDSGSVVFESGRLGEDGAIDGADTDADFTQREPHYDVIDSPQQVQIYESIMQDSEGAITQQLTRAASYAKDNRLLADGMTRDTLPDDIAVIGAAAVDDDFLGGSDRITYRIAEAPAGVLHVDAELVYQPLAYGHLQDLFASDHLASVSEFRRLFDAASLKAEVIASARQSLP